MASSTWHAYLLRLGVVLSAVLPLFFYSPTAAAATKEYQVKAAFIYNFIQFISWPHGFADRNTVGVCVFGEDPFRDALDLLAQRAVRLQSGKELKIVVRRDITPMNVTACDVLFVNTNKSNEATLLGLTGGKPILTIGESRDFAEGGGIIGFFERDARIAFKINMTYADKAQFKVSSKMLELAEIIQ